jgi:hypothetical protein
MAKRDPFDDEPESGDEPSKSESDNASESTNEAASKPPKKSRKKKREPEPEPESAVVAATEATTPSDASQVDPLAIVTASDPNTKPKASVKHVPTIDKNTQNQIDWLNEIREQQKVVEDARARSVIQSKASKTAKAALSDEENLLHEIIHGSDRPILAQSASLATHPKHDDDDNDDDSPAAGLMSDATTSNESTSEADVIGVVGETVELASDPDTWRRIRLDAIGLNPRHYTALRNSNFLSLGQIEDYRATSMRLDDLKGVSTEGANEIEEKILDTLQAWRECKIEVDEYFPHDWVPPKAEGGNV